ncbi:MAG: SIS domain-containing protein [Bacilli bacterium]
MINCKDKYYDGSKYIIKEISQQGELWQRVFEQISNELSELDVYVKNFNKVIFLGAGTSEFVGNVVTRALNKYDREYLSISTTDFITNPEYYLQKDEKVLFVSIARSGNSPESVEAVNLGSSLSKTVKHLIITCNKNGKLALLDDCMKIILPMEANDKSFAMTSSFTSLILASYLIFAENREESESNLSKLLKNFSDIINEFDKKLEKIMMPSYDRIVFLGTNVLKAIAQESALKVMELSAGRIATLHDSFLGYRHGPVTFTYGDKKTLVVAYLSSKEKTRKYEKDMLIELNQFKFSNQILIIDNVNCDDMDNLADEIIKIDSSMNEIYYGMNCIIVAQLIGLMSSWKYGIDPDEPYKNGECSGNANIYQ